MKVQTSAQLKCFDRILIELRMNQFNCTYIMPNDNKDIPMPTNLNELKQPYKEEWVKILPQQRLIKSYKTRQNKKTSESINLC